jgi:hypothetical protein
VGRGACLVPVLVRLGTAIFSNGGCEELFWVMVAPNLRKAGSLSLVLTSAIVLGGGAVASLISRCTASNSSSIAIGAGEMMARRSSTAAAMTPG